MLSHVPLFQKHLLVLSVFLLINTLLLRPESYLDDLELAEGLSDGELCDLETLKRVL